MFQSGHFLQVFISDWKKTKGLTLQGRDKRLPLETSRPALLTVCKPLVPLTRHPCALYKMQMKGEVAGFLFSRAGPLHSTPKTLPLPRPPFPSNDFNLCSSLSPLNMLHKKVGKEAFSFLPSFCLTAINTNNFHRHDLPIYTCMLQRQ